MRLLRTLLALAMATGHTHAHFLLWAHGRSATETFFQTLKRNIDIGECNQRKEGFSFVAPTSESLASCAATACGGRSRCVVGTHIKPGHVRNGMTPHGLMAAVKQAGWRVVVVIERQNSLSQILSSIAENAPKNCQAAVYTNASARSQCKMNFTHRMLLKEARSIHGLMENGPHSGIHGLHSGMAAARDLGMTVLHLDFSHVTGALCQCAVCAEAALQRHYPWISVNDSCVTKIGHTHRRPGYSGDKNNLVDRVQDRSLASFVAGRLKGTEHEWMLDLGATHPPDQFVPDTPSCSRANKVL